MHPAHSQTVNPTKRFELMARECADRFAKEYPSGRIVGKFRSYSANNLIIKMVMGDALVVAAPTQTFEFLGLKGRGYTGCAFTIHTNGSLSFQRILNSRNFPTRGNLEPGED